jgi:hypothetical protein
MRNNLSKITKLIAGVLAIIGLYFFARIMVAGNDQIQESLSLQSNVIGPFITFTQILLMLVISAALIFSVINIITHPNLLKKFLISISVLSILFLLVYFTASGAAVTNNAGMVVQNGEAGATSKLVSTGITYSAILGVVGIFFFLFDFAKSMTK